MNRLKAVIIDDETSSRNSLRQKIVGNCPEVEIIEECRDAEEGIKAIEKTHPDIVFLAVEMPRINGFVMLQQLKERNFELIFTTAYDHYAINAIRYSALDYLVKPIEVEELKVAVERARQKREEKNPNQRIETLLHNLIDSKPGKNRIAIPSMEGLQFVELSDIIYLAAESNYSIIYLTNNIKLTVTRTLKDFEELLPSSLFIRIHHSYIINKDHVQKYIRGDGGRVSMSNGKELEVARRKKEEFIKSIGG